MTQKYIYVDRVTRNTSNKYYGLRGLGPTIRAAGSFENPAMVLFPFGPFDLVPVRPKPKAAPKPKKYEITLNEIQLHVLEAALKAISQIGLGQFREILAFYRPLPGTYNAVQDACDDLIKAAGHNSPGPRDIFDPRVSDSVRIVLDIQRAISLLQGYNWKTPVGPFKFPTIVTLPDQHPKCPECPGDLGETFLGRLEEHRSGCSRFPL